MEYKVMRIDPRSITEESIAFATGTLTINIPQRAYNAGCPYFLRIVDEIPDETTIGAEVVITIGESTVEYPLLGCNGVALTAENLRSGYSYPVTVVSNNTIGAFRLLAPIRYSRCGAAFSIDGTDPAAVAP